MWDNVFQVLYHINTEMDSKHILSIRDKGKIIKKKHIKVPKCVLPLCQAPEDFQRIHSKAVVIN